MRDDPNVKSGKEFFLIRRQHLKHLYAEMSDRLKMRKKDQTPANRQLFSAMGEALRRSTGKMGGAPRSNAPRCPCGQMTRARAQHQYHHCDKNGLLPSRLEVRRMAQAKYDRDLEKHGEQYAENEWRKQFGLKPETD